MNLVVIRSKLDMLVDVPPPEEERVGDLRDNAEGGGGDDNGEAGTDAADINGAVEHPNGLARDPHSLTEGLLSTRNVTHD